MSSYLVSDEAGPTPSKHPIEQTSNDVEVLEDGQAPTMAPAILPQDSRGLRWPRVASSA